MGGSINGESQNGWFIMEKWLKMADLEIHPMLGNLHILNMIKLRHRSVSSTLPGAAVRLRSYLWRFPINQGEPGTTPWHLEQNGEKTMTHPLRNYTLKASLIKNLAIFVVDQGFHPGSRTWQRSEKHCWCCLITSNPFPSNSPCFRQDCAHWSLQGARLAGRSPKWFTPKKFVLCLLNVFRHDRFNYASKFGCLEGPKISTNIVNLGSIIHSVPFGGLSLLGAVPIISICSFHQLHAFRIS